MLLNDRPFQSHVESSASFTAQKKIKELMDKGATIMGGVARRFSTTAKVGASALASSEAAQGAAAATTEAAR